VPDKDWPAESLANFDKFTCSILFAPSNNVFIFFLVEEVKRLSRKINRVPFSQVWDVAEC